MSDDLKPCNECGMPCESGEYHPYAACLMFKGCKNSKIVRDNLHAISTRPQEEAKDKRIKELEEALKFYASESNYQTVLVCEGHGNYSIYFACKEEDCGETAKQALEGKE